MSLVSINGQIDRLVAAHFLCADRGLHYGDGLFETIAVQRDSNLQNHPYLEYHFTRLQNGIHRLHFPALDFSQLREQIKQFVEHVHQSQLEFSKWVLKIIVTRGQSGRGYQPQLNTMPNIILMQNPYPEYSPSFKTEGVSVGWSSVIIPIDPLLAGIKHLNRLTQVMASLDMEPYVERLLCDASGHVIEGTKSNLFFVDDGGQIKTPCLRQSGVTGVLRTWIIDQLDRLGQPVTVLDVKPSDLREAEEIFLCNSIIGIWPVKKLAECCYKVGEISKMLQSLLLVP